MRRGREIKKSKLFYFVLLLAAVSFFTVKPFTEKASASGHDSYLPDTTKLLKYAHSEGSSTQEFSHAKDGKYIWKGIYSYGGDQYFTKYYKEDKSGLIIGNLDHEKFFFMNLAYPVKVGTTWSYTDYEGKKITCKISSVTKTIKIRAGAFKNVVEVKESNGTYRYFAKNVGLIKVYRPNAIFDADYLELVSIKTKITVLWGNSELKKGQIGRITVQKPINLWKRDKDHRLQFVRILKPFEQYRVYTYDQQNGGQYGLGAGYSVTKMPTHIKYKTPSKQLLDKLK
ncbi:5'-Nucleotidase domain protein [Bacillus methanolicus PB1]|uniref:5'-Nucleotidase domain protein n=1 Tax=Bacillus methanolicus PB1 TaxID=997296 RepID=I3E1M2_BACMT|nr:5'-Nucleotidase domain protein [Bacillus methanolicus PB1]